MKIFFAATTPFAVNAFLKNHLLALSASYEITVLVNKEAYPLDEEISTGVRVINVGFERNIFPVRDILCFVHLCWVFLREQPDAVHSIMPKSGMLAMAAALLTFRRRRFHTFTGQVWVNKYGWKRAILKSFDRLIAFMATRVLADSHSQARFIETEGVTRLGQILVLGKGSIAGVDQGRFKVDSTLRNRMRTELQTKTNACVFLFVGRITRDKGILDLLTAFEAVSKQRPECELWLVGPDDESICKNWLAEEQVPTRIIRCVGATDKPERYMAAADVLVLPSYREGFGQVVIEAAACGVPTIAYRIDGVIDAVADQESGLLVPVGDTRALAAAMINLCDDEDRKIKLAQQGLQRVKTDFAASAVTRSWLDFYKLQMAG